MEGEIRKVAGHSATYAVGVMAGGLGRVVLIPIVAHFLTADEYGIVALVLAFVSLAAILMDMGFSTSLIKFYSETEDPASKKRVVSTIVLSGVASGVAVSILLVPLGRMFSSIVFQRADYTHFIYLGLGLALASTLFRVTLSYFQAVPAPTRYATASVAKGGLAVVGAAVFVIYLAWGPAGFLVGTLLPPALLSVVLIPLVLGKVGLGFDLWWQPYSWPGRGSSSSTRVRKAHRVCFRFSQTTTFSSWHSSDSACPCLRRRSSE